MYTLININTGDKIGLYYSIDAAITGRLDLPQEIRGYYKVGKAN